MFVVYLNGSTPTLLPTRSECISDTDEVFFVSFNLVMLRLKQFRGNFERELESSRVWAGVRERDGWFDGQKEKNETEIFYLVIT